MSLLGCYYKKWFNDWSGQKGPEEPIGASLRAKELAPPFADERIPGTRSRYKGE